MNTESEMPGAEKGEQANINAFRSFNVSEQIDCFNNMAKGKVLGYLQPPYISYLFTFFSMNCICTSVTYTMLTC